MFLVFGVLPSYGTTHVPPRHSWTYAADLPLTLPVRGLEDTVLHNEGKRPSSYGVQRWDLYLVYGPRLASVRVARGVLRSARTYAFNTRSSDHVHLCVASSSHAQVLYYLELTS